MTCSIVSRIQPHQRCDEWDNSDSRFDCKAFFNFFLFDRKKKQVQYFINLLFTPFFCVRKQLAKILNFHCRPHQNLVIHPEFSSDYFSRNRAKIAVHGFKID